ncbi:MAG: glycosyltransferase involved in cell wall biosynthesis [Pirellulaceae bacterium]|jgi:glycosyltransferase involved in cell wall biosynthesis
MLDRRQGRSVKPSISFVLPIHNSQDSLAQAVANVVEIIPELSANFEVLIVDDGSTDATEEVARELAMDFPQLKVMRSAEQVGVLAAGQLGLKQATGDFIFVHEGNELSFYSSEISKLWAMRDDEDLVMARTKTTTEPTVSPTLLSHITHIGRSQSRRPYGNVKMIRRRRPASKFIA